MVSKCTVLVWFLLIRNLDTSRHPTLYPCPNECVCPSHDEVLCNTGNLNRIPIDELPRSTLRLELTKNNITELETEAFSRVKHIQEILISGNNITKIGKFAFRGLKRIQYIRIDHEPLRKLEEYSFAAIANLTSLILVNNKIEVIKEFAFLSSNNIRVLLLVDNPIKVIETNAFAGLRNVEYLILPDGINRIQPDAFHGYEASGLVRLQALELKALEPYTFRGMSRVHVISVQESDLGVIQPNAFSGLHTVGSLNFINNKIDSIIKLVVKREHNVLNLKFLGNHLLKIPRPGVVKLQALEKLIVDGNHFPCDCWIHSLLEGPFANSTNGNFTNTNYCIYPMHVHSKPISALDLQSVTRCDRQHNTGNLPYLGCISVLIFAFYLLI